MYKQRSVVAFAVASHIFSTVAGINTPNYGSALNNIVLAYEVSSQDVCCLLRMLEAVLQELQQRPGRFLFVEGLLAKL